MYRLIVIQIPRSDNLRAQAMELGPRTVVVPDINADAWAEIHDNIILSVAIQIAGLDDFSTQRGIKAFLANKGRTQSSPLQCLRPIFVRIRLPGRLLRTADY